jgi:hypothetical protein
MAENFRRFEAGPDPFGRTWQIEFRWLQTGISIRHADTVDVKFVVWTADEHNPESKQEKILALSHPALLALAEKTGHPLTDGWCLMLAARHLKFMVESGEDLEKTLVTLAPHDLERAAQIAQPV